MPITATFTVANWDEEPLWEGPDGAKVTRAEVSQEVAGDLVGTGVASWLMFYRADGTADYTGFQRFEGTMEGRRGALVLRSEGTFDGSTASGRLDVTSGAEGLAGVTGAGTFEAPHGSAATVRLELTRDRPTAG